MARRNGAVLAHPPVCFYRADAGYDYQLRTDEQTSPDGTRCGTLTTITVRLMLVNRTAEGAHHLDERG